jgi:hypothetical protein
MNDKSMFTHRDKETLYIAPVAERASVILCKNEDGSTSHITIGDEYSESHSATVTNKYEAIRLCRAVMEAFSITPETISGIEAKERLGENASVVFFKTADDLIAIKFMKFPSAPSRAYTRPCYPFRSAMPLIDQTSISDQTVKRDYKLRHPPRFNLDYGLPEIVYVEDVKK